MTTKVDDRSDVIQNWEYLLGELSAWGVKLQEGVLETIDTHIRGNHQKPMQNALTASLEYVVCCPSGERIRGFATYADARAQADKVKGEIGFSVPGLLTNTDLFSPISGFEEALTEGGKLTKQDDPTNFQGVKVSIYPLWEAARRWSILKTNGQNICSSPDPLAGTPDSLVG